jgi:DNA-binding NarL/FixJ family response regulator
MEITEHVEQNFATVLVVEASPGDAMAMRRMLGVLGLRTIVLVDSAERALAFLARESCDLILSEYALKDTNGVHLIENVRRLYPETPVIMVSGVNDERLIAAAIAAGAEDFIPKDARLQADLFKAIRAALAPKPKQRDAVPELAVEHGPAATTLGNIDANWLVNPFTEGTHLDAFERSTLLHAGYANEQLAAAVNEFAEYIRVCLDPAGTDVRVHEEALLRIFIDQGLGPSEILAVFRGAVHELTVDPLFAIMDPRVSLSAVLARILCRWGQDYQWQLWLQINEPAA